MAGASKGHVRWIDAARGIGIVLVVFGHSTDGGPLFRFVFSFHMPLFFFLSGVASNLSRQEDFVRRHVVSRMVPYAVFAAITFLWRFCASWDFRLPESLDIGSTVLDFVLARGMAGSGFNVTLWFLPCLLSVELLHHAIATGLKGGAARALAVAGLLVLAFALSGTAPFPASWRLPFRLPLVLDTALACLSFYAAGAWLGRFPAVMEGRTGIPAWAAALALLAVYVLAGPATEEFLDLRPFVFPSPPRFAACAALGVGAVAVLAARVSAGWVAGLGRMSLAVMLLHPPVEKAVLVLIGRVSGVPARALLGSLPGSLLATAATVACCVPLALLVDAFCPWMLGRRARGAAPRGGRA